MSLVEDIVAAHGGLDRWNQVGTLVARMSYGGPFWAGRGWGGVLDDVTLRIDTAREHLTITPYTAPGRVLTYDVTPAGAERLTLTAPDGAELEHRDDPRSGFPPYSRDTGWDALQTSYFTSVATWNYLSEPWLFTRPEVTAVEIEPWEEGGETWRRLAVTFPGELPNHNPDQVFYADEGGLLRRMDYLPDVTGTPIAHYLDEPREFGGLVFPTRRRVYGRRPDNTADQSLAFITIDVASVELLPR